MEIRELHSYKSFVFDLDGTLLDTTKDIGLALGKALGHEFTDEQVMGFVGRGLRNAVKAAAQFLNLENPDIDALTSDLIEHYRQVPVLYTKPYPGAVEILGKLQKRGVPFLIYSNKDQDLTETIVRICFGDLKQVMIVGMHGGFDPKPSSQAIDAFLSSSGLRRTDILYVGDTEVDYRTAVNSKVDCLILTGGMRSKEELLSNGVDPSVMVESLQKIVDNL